MAEAKAMEKTSTEEDSDILRIYETGYHISPAVKEEDIEKIVASIRAVIEKAGGSFIAEGAPTLLKLAFPMYAKEGGKRVEYDRSYFGWLKFESTIESAQALDEFLKANTNLLRSILFQTVREDTRAKIKMGGLREVKRTDSIKATPRKEETAAPVSEEDLEKALQDLTAE